MLAFLRAVLVSLSALLRVSAYFRRMTMDPREIVSGLGDWGESRVRVVRFGTAAISAREAATIVEQTKEPFSTGLSV